MVKEVKRGRPSKKVETPTLKMNVKTVKMNDLIFDKKLFEPMGYGNEGG